MLPRWGDSRSSGPRRTLPCPSPNRGHPGAGPRRRDHSPGGRYRTRVNANRGPGPPGDRPPQERNCRDSNRPRQIGRAGRANYATPARRLDRARQPRDRHDPGARRGRRAEGRQRPSRHRDEPRAAGLPAVPARAAARPLGSELGRPGPLRTLRRTRQPDPVHPAVPLRLRHDAAGSGVAAHLGQPDPRSPRARPHAGRGDHHRPTRAGRRQRGRHGDGRQVRARPARPGRRARREPVRPPHLRDRLRRRHGGGRRRRRRPRWPVVSSSAT